MKKHLRNLLVIALVICSLLSLSSCYLSELGIELPSRSEEGESEGGSGGALGIGVGNKVRIMENAYYSVITPEGCAAILWKDRAYSAKAARSALPEWNAS